jgi:hypothetical protein
MLVFEVQCCNVADDQAVTDIEDCLNSDKWGLEKLVSKLRLVIQPLASLMLRALSTFSGRPKDSTGLPVEL